MRAALFAAIMSLQGCAVLMAPVPDDAYTWQKTGPELPASEHIIPQQAVQAYCNTTSRFVMACAYRDHERCYIFASSKGLMDMMRKHEARHCEGWDHQII